jgi:UDP-glucose 4-epimerase
MKILISGGAGFIGSNSVDFFARKGFSIVVIDNLLSGFYKNIADLVDKGSVKFYEADIRDQVSLEKIFRENTIDICINFAALVSVAESTEKPKLTEDINVNGMINLIESCGKNRVKHIIHASSAAVYGDSEELPKNEDMVPVPKSPYAITKLAGEYYNKYFSHMFGYNAVNCRFFNVFGPKQNPDSQYAAAIPIFIKRAIGNKDIMIYGDGGQTRDFIFVKDLISAIFFLVENPGRLHDNTTFNLGYGNFISIIDLVKLIIEITGSRSKIVYSDPRPGDIKYSYASVNKLKMTGWVEEYGFDKGLKETIQWYMENGL